MTTILTEGLTKSYGSRHAIEDVNLEISAGSLFGFLGPNGAGKTTTIRILMGLLRPSAGRAEVMGMNTWTDSHRIKADVGYISGDLRLYPWMTARNGLRVIGRVRQRNISRRGMELVERFELDPDVPTRKMSRGMRQKLGLVLALAHDPRLIIFDEPTTALDPPMQQVLYDLLQESATNGATVFFSSHTLSEVETLCDRVAILRDGAIVANERLETLRGQAKRVVTLTFNSDVGSRNTLVPEFLDVVERAEGRWRCILNGPVMDFVRWSGTVPLEDLVVSPPDLDELFRHYYHQESEDIS